MLGKLKAAFDEFAVALGIREETLENLRSPVFSSTRAVGYGGGTLETRVYMTAEPISQMSYHLFTYTEKHYSSIADGFSRVSKVPVTGGDYENKTFSSELAKKKLAKFSTSMRATQRTWMM